MGNTRLTKLRVQEISGVDDPANELPGWLVVKSKEIDHDLRGFEKAIGDLFESLDSPEAELYFKDAPESVLKARDEMLKHLADDVEEVDEPEGGVFDIEKAGAYDDPDGETEPGKSGDGEIPDKHEVPGNTGSEEPGEGQDVAPDLNPGSTDTTDKYGRVVDPESGDVVADPNAPDGDPDKPSADEPADELEEKEEEKEEPEPEEESKDESEDESEDEKPAEKPKPKSRKKKTADKDESDDESVDKSEDIAKSIAGVLEEQLSPLREAIIGLAERTEGLEKHAAGRQGIDLDPDVPNAVGETGLTKAVRSALQNGRVELR